MLKKRFDRYSLKYEKKTSFFLVWVVETPPGRRVWLGQLFSENLKLRAYQSASKNYQKVDFDHVFPQYLYR